MRHQTGPRTAEEAHLLCAPYTSLRVEDRLRAIHLARDLALNWIQIHLDGSDALFECSLASPEAYRDTLLAPAVEKGWVCSETAAPDSSDPRVQSFNAAWAEGVAGRMRLAFEGWRPRYGELYGMRGWWKTRTPPELATEDGALPATR